MRAANQNIEEEYEGDHVLHLQERRACGSRSHHKANHVNGEAQRCQNCPNPGAHPLTSHRVVPAGAVEQHAAYEPRDSNTENECCPKRPHVRLHERIQDEVSEVEGHQEDMRKIGHAEELRCECRLVQGVCEGASDGVHRDVSRRRGVRCLEVRVGASRRRRRRLEIRVVALQGVGSEKPHSKRHTILLWQFR
eukprot:scaffold44847_cov71-Phaeocystis_antarctica.AAC.4